MALKHCTKIRIYAQAPELMNLSLEIEKSREIATVPLQRWAKPLRFREFFRVNILQQFRILKYVVFFALPLWGPPPRPPPLWYGWPPWCPPLWNPPRPPRIGPPAPPRPPPRDPEGLGPALGPLGLTATGVLGSSFFTSAALILVLKSNFECSPNLSQIFTIFRWRQVIPKLFPGELKNKAKILLKTPNCTYLVTYLWSSGKSEWHLNFYNFPCYSKNYLHLISKILKLNSIIEIFENILKYM